MEVLLSEYPREVIVHDSSQIKVIRFNPTTRSVLVKFTNGTWYQYLSIPINKLSAFVVSSSIGSEFAASIRPNYQGRKVSVR